MANINNSPMSLRQIMSLVEEEKSKFTNLEGSAGEVAGKTSDESIAASTQYKNTLEGQEQERDRQATATLALTCIAGAVNGAAAVGVGGASIREQTSTTTLEGLGGTGQWVGMASELVLSPAVNAATSTEQAVITKKMAGLQKDGSELQAAVLSLGDTAGNTVDQMNQLTDVGANLATQLRNAVSSMNEASTQPNDR